MIISASYKTDIPAFYGEWFLNRLKAGYCVMSNPYNRNLASRISLLREHVDGFVFWTKNAGPFLEVLEEVHQRTYPFIIQYTINAYPRTLEFSVTDATRALKQAYLIATKYGAKSIVWRYDPILFTSETPPERHMEAFDWLAGRLEGVTDEVVISFAQVYEKTKRNMDWASREFNFTWTDPDDQTKRNLMRELLKIARTRKMKLTLCSQPYLIEPGVEESHCVDARRLSALVGRDIHAHLKGPRKECGCFESKDIGDYDTCPHGCVYCYAVQNRKLAQSRYRQHDPCGERLFGPDIVTKTDGAQQSLFE
ncbi:MAG: DUF1848 domain-containing protein [Terracidiphilus sp.]|jgi:hypothetical protein